MRLNQLIAEKVMGWRVYSTNNAGLVLMDEAMARDWGPTGVVLATQAELDAKKYIKTTYVPEYSTSIEAAWEVVRHLKQFWFGISYAEHADEGMEHERCAVSVHQLGSIEHITSAVGTELPQTICIAALRAVAVPESEITAAMEAK